MSSMMEVDDIIHHLREGMRFAQPGKNSNLNELDIQYLIAEARSTFLSQPMLLELSPPMKICGNLLGQFKDLLRIFETGKSPPDANYLFLGDYVDRGYQSTETICLLLSYKIKYPNSVFLLRGHHECERVTRKYGFYDECKKRFSENLWLRFVDCFNCMPVAAVIGRKIFCCHGGLSPELSNLDQIKVIPRPIDVPENGLLCDLLWADPSEEVDGWSTNPHGSSVRFGNDILEQFMKKFQFDLMVRSHQVVEYGYEFFGKKKLLTIFSAPNFCESGNYGAMMIVNKSLLCSFDILKTGKRFSCDNANFSHLFVLGEEPLKY